MTEQDDQKKPDRAEINQDLFQQAAELKKKTQQTNEKLDELRRQTQELLDKDKNN